MQTQTGWKPIPTSLKILFVLFCFWILGSIMAISQRVALGVPFFGLWVFGLFAGLIVFILDILGPITFMFGLWTRKHWAVTVAFLYMGVFVLNSLVALFTVKEQLGIMPILIPALFNVGFLAVIYSKRKYFS